MTLFHKRREFQTKFAIQAALSTSVSLTFYEFSEALHWRCSTCCPMPDFENNGECNTITDPDGLFTQCYRIQRNVKYDTSGDATRWGRSTYDVNRFFRTVLDL